MLEETGRRVVSIEIDEVNVRIGRRSRMYRKYCAAMGRALNERSFSQRLGATSKGGVIKLFLAM